MRLMGKSIWPLMPSATQTPGSWMAPSEVSGDGGGGRVGGGGGVNMWRRGWIVERLRVRVGGCVE